MRITLATFLIAAYLWMLAGVAARSEPELLSLFPLGGQKGSQFKIVVRGRSMDGSATVWFDCDRLSATVAGLETDKSQSSTAPKKKKKSSSGVTPLQLMTLTVKVAPGAESGLHYMRILTPLGISNSLSIRVHGEPSLSNDGNPHELAESAQPISAIPVVINGKISQSGEVDYYSFEAKEGETLRFDAVSSGGGLDPGLTIFEPTGSWFRPDRLTEIAFNDEPISYPGISSNASITHKFVHKGRYFVRVNGFLGQSGSDYTYQLFIRRGGQAESDLMRTAHSQRTPDISWQERSWRRELTPERLKTLWSRSVEPSDSIPEMSVLRFDGKEHKSSRESVPVTLPVLIEGTIEHPADIDRVKFRVEGGDAVALEVETVEKTIPEFNPYLRIVSTNGDEAFTNVHSTVNTCGDLIIKQIQPKTTYSFPREGEYVLEIRDITHLYGDKAFRYRVILRQQVPHVGEVHIAGEQVNLMAGEVTKLSVDTDQEEGFDGQIALTVEGLPAGVRAVMGTELQPKVPAPYNAGKIERFRPESQKATFLFMTGSDASPTSSPVEARIIAQPVVKGKLGRPILVKKILFTVVQPGLLNAKDRQSKMPETR